MTIMSYALCRRERITEHTSTAKISVKPLRQVLNKFSNVGSLKCLQHVLVSDILSRSGTEGDVEADGAL